MKVRIRFAKYGLMRYVGHLDLMRYFQKALRRAELPVKYSEGFSPHMILSFATALGVGITSGGEYMETELILPLSCEEIKSRLMIQMTDGIDILSVHVLPDNAKNAMAALCAAEYEVAYLLNDGMRYSASELESEIASFTAPGNSIMITKKTKKGERTLDIAPFIYNLSLVSYEDSSFKSGMFMRPEAADCQVLRMLLSAGSTENIRPEHVMGAFLKHIGVTSTEDNSMVSFIHRLDLFEDFDGKIVSMSEVVY